MKVLFYCQHVLGLGHFMRSLEIMRALAPDEVVLASGGPPVPVGLPPHVREVRLPALEMDPAFTRLSATDGGGLDEVKAARRETLFRLFDDVRPDVFFVELYPFGRKAFEFELLPVLRAAREGRFGPVRVVCGLRDILVEKTDREGYEARVLSRLNASFDLLAIHADPALFPLEATFSRAADIAVPVRYTGYVAPGVVPARDRSPASDARVRQRLSVGPGRRLIVASAGGGRVGGEVLAAVACALARPEAAALGPVSLRVFSGPYAPDEEFAALEAAVAVLPDARVARFDADFPAVLRAADLSVSLAGYNTVMAVLAAGVRALVRPFDQNREQRLRASRLEHMGLVGLLEPDDLEPARLFSRMARLLGGDPPPPAAVRLDGAAESARLLREAAGRG
ncbi:glycosyltransferase family protein [Desulfolutivibrio sulfoxidireducens]|uniref:glycosyltransferase family protein n=1 Tax=Desulfolutivibrio sulfoxidireducens TaxID=2773299 RepID=UPI00159D31F5|nr:glycosyltransferase [Desulfolutivibrio sulfoxidireducens]QLA17153.1 glycosyltransferase [Desulfolutivibrio sulfoxidireducens]QLA20723.1 glycosyltransferase [Desulfolutivibrio sulfoxidireducens]